MVVADREEGVRPVEVVDDDLDFGAEERLVEEDREAADERELDRQEQRERRGRDRQPFSAGLLQRLLPASGT